MPPTIIPALHSHLPSCLSIYNHYALDTIVTFHITAQSLSFLQATHEKAAAAGLPFLVVVEEEEVLGYAYAVPYRAEREAYQQTVEITLILRPGSTGAGLGKRLLSALKKALSEAGITLPHDRASTGKSEGYNQVRIREVVAMVAMEQDERVGEGTRAGKFYEREGFTKVGVMKGLGRKFGRSVDVGIFQWSVPGEEHI